jgi:hypothetical protein
VQLVGSERAPAGHEARGDQGHHGRPGNEPRPVEDGLNREGQRDGRERDERDPGRVPVAARRRRVAVGGARQPAREQAGRAQGRHDPGEHQERRHAQAEQAEVRHRLGDPAVRMAGDRGVGAVTKAAHGEGARAHALDRPVVEHAEGLAPVLAA